MKKVFLSVTGALLIIATGAFAQSYSTGPVVSSVAPNVKLGTTLLGASLFQFEADSTSRYTQFDLLKQIDAIVNSKHRSISAKERSSIENALATVALSGTEYRAIDGGPFVINNFPLLRMRACHTIGQLGGAQAEKILLKVLHYDRDPLVLAEASYELGRMKQNPNDAVSNAIAAALQRTVIYQSEGQFAYSALKAFSALARAGQLKADPSVYLAISTVGEIGLSNRVRQQALATLQTLATYG